MKNWIALICVLVFAAAPLQGATTVQLFDTPTTTTGVSYNVGNSGGLKIDWLSFSNSYGRVTLSLNGVLYDSGLHAVTNPGSGFSNLKLTSASGGVVYASASYRHWVTKVNSGRAHYYIQHCELDGGTFQ